MTAATLARLLRSIGLMLRGDPRAFDLLENSAAEARRSFLAALYCLPLYILQMALALLVTDRADEALFAWIITLGLQYVIGWTLFPVLMEGVCALLGRRDRFFLWLAAYNWIKVPLVLAMTPLMIVAVLDTDGGAATFLHLLFFVGMAFYLTFVARRALALPMSAAVGVVVLDILLDEIVHGLMSSL